MKQNNDYNNMQQGEKVTIDDFIIPQKVTAFTTAYRPAKKQTLTSEVFTDTRLREFFKAYVTKVGDPLAEYISRLERLGYKMQVSLTGEPAIIVELA